MPSYTKRNIGTINMFISEHVKKTKVPKNLTYHRIIKQNLKYNVNVTRKLLPLSYGSKYIYQELLGKYFMWLLYRSY